MDGVALLGAGVVDDGALVLGAGVAADGVCRWVSGVDVVGFVSVWVVGVVSVVDVLVVEVDVEVVDVVDERWLRWPPKIVVELPEPRPIEWPEISSGTVKSTTQTANPSSPVITAMRQRSRLERVE